MNNAPSVPNLTLLIRSLAGSRFSGSVLCKAVGPPNKVPKVPASSTSPIKSPSNVPPVTAPAPNLAALPFEFNLASLVVVSTKILPLSSASEKYLPAFLVLNAVLAMEVPILKPTPPGTPMLTNSSAIFPAVVASAFSSHSVRSSKYFSTCAALLVPAPRSIKDAPKEKIPLGS